MTFLTSRAVRGTSFALSVFVSSAMLAGCAEEAPTDTQAWAGTLQVMSDGEPDDRFFLDVGGEAWLKLHFREETAASSTLDHLQSGQRVTVHGSLVDGTIEASDFEIESQADALTTVGQRNVLVLIGRFAGQPDVSMAEINAKMFGATSSAAAYYREASFGQVSLSGTVRGPFNLSGYTQTCGMSQWMGQATAAAKASGINVDSFNHVMLVFPKVDACKFAGWASVGGKTVYINGNSTFTTHAMVHELGHNFGLKHASSHTCWSSTGTPLIASGTCKTEDYVDTVDVMGNRYLGHFSAYHKEKLGWLRTGNIAVANTPGTYTIRPIEFASSGVQSLRVPRSDGTFYAVELRQQAGFDSNLKSTSVNGVFVRIVGELSSQDDSKLLDMNPNTSTRDDAPLLEGVTFAAPLAPFQLRLADITSNGAVVQVMSR
jgi:hypothetical protein